MADSMVVRRRGGGYMTVPVLDAPMAAQQAQIDGLVSTARALPTTFAQAEQIHAHLGQRIDQLAAAVAELAQRPTPAPVQQPEVDLGPLQDAVAALQEHVAADVPAPDVAPLAARLAMVEAAVADLAARLAALPPGLPPTPNRKP